jgi:hypothetical protein
MPCQADYTLKQAYFAFTSISNISCGVIFRRNSTHSKRAFIVLKEIIRIMAPCREICKKFNILTLASEFQVSLLCFAVDSVEKFQTNS